MDYLPQFKIWLQTKGYSDSTSRNYLVDLGKYLNYVNHLPQTISLDPDTPSGIHIFSPDILSLYVSYLSGKNNASRYLASLHRFCQFALDQHLISTNPLKNIHQAPPAPNLSDLVNLYEQYLTKHHAPLSTIRNYINDLHQYISWLKTLPIDPK
jgi:site-specific recombinase XerD